jgi:hypothetical protein
MAARHADHRISEIYRAARDVLEAAVLAIAASRGELRREPDQNLRQGRRIAALVVDDGDRLVLHQVDAVGARRQP